MEKYERRTKSAPKNQQWCSYVLKDKDCMKELTDDTPPSQWENNFNSEISVSIDVLGEFEDLMEKYKIPTISELENIIAKVQTKGMK